MRWYSEIGSIDEGQADKTKEIYANMRKFTDWNKRIHSKTFHVHMNAIDNTHLL
jgi:hypothetical protein